MLSSHPLYIALLGPTDCPPDLIDAAEEAGRLIAGKSAVLLCGGGPGAAEAAARGANKAGGRSEEHTSELQSH